ncbi:MAG TPA: hypothetical protein VFU47_03315, partial [Armatimonadota bacterium]|nr:hypothetical protein [Armatimonadota bacterium]
MLSKLSAGLVATGLLLLGVPAQAAPISFTLAPMTVEHSVPGKGEVTGVIGVTHELPPGAKKSELEPMKLRVYAMDWDLDRKGQPNFQKPGSFPGNCSTWVQINPVDLTVPPGEKRDVRYTIRVPEGVQGTFHTVIMFETAQQAQKEGARVVTVSGRVGTTIYVQVGPQSKRARISAFSVTPEKSVVTVQNTGTSHVRLQGQLQFRDEAGKMVSQVPLPGGVVLPGSSNVREFAVETPKLPGSGKYSVTA